MRILDLFSVEFGISWIGVADAIVKATLRLDGAGVPQFTQLSTIVANETDWRLISANVGLTWATTPTFARVFLEGPPAGTDILVDDASVRLFVP